jgi:hypothetical protein
MEYKIYDENTIIEFGRFKGWEFMDLFDWSTDEDNMVEYAYWFIKEIDNIIIHDDIKHRVLVGFNEEIEEILSERKSDYIEKVLGNNGKVYWDRGEYRACEDDDNTYYDDDNIWNDVEHEDLLDDMYWNLD